ncbi:hypothetical protein HMPREF9135_0662 [Segatella baroniae F0067]|uniref:Uncharacterized protein n=1 Tax=Segatella baroniae F0067 TaxID=1115809 RepID=U2QJI1_9BACT|nr:hypothetical protein HMPREF9135_0662 [Segatella baroniae F0067]
MFSKSFVTVLQKDSFRPAKAVLLACESLAFATRKGSGRNVKGQRLENAAAPLGDERVVVARNAAFIS